MSSSIERILEIVESGRPLSVAEIAEQAKVSKATVYRTLKRLEGKGLINRLSTGIVLPKEAETSFSRRLSINIDKKREMAEKAVSLVKDGDIIFIDASTTCLAFATELARSDLSRISVATNSTFVVNELSEGASGFYVVCTGGELQPSLNALVGPITCSSIRSMNFHKAFLSGAAFSCDTGLMTTQTSLVEVLRTASSCAAETIALVDSTKFHKEAFLNVLDCSKVKTIVSDSGLDSTTRRMLESKGIRVLE
jgi:DeoR/GlpR family transcriptional regulator of sugar metabolism